MCSESTEVDSEYELLVRQIELCLKVHGSMHVEAIDLTVSSAMWRRAARAAGRRLGMTIRTGRAGGGADLRARHPMSPAGGWAVWVHVVPGPDQTS